MKIIDSTLEIIIWSIITYGFITIEFKVKYSIFERSCDYNPLLPYCLTVYSARIFCAEGYLKWVQWKYYYHIYVWYRKCFQFLLWVPLLPRQILKFNTTSRQSWCITSAGTIHKWIVIASNPLRFSQNI